jgi:uncharacterized protein
MTPPCLRPSGDGWLLDVKVQPRSSRNEIVGLHGDRLRIRITAPPVDSAANHALTDFLAEQLGCPRARVRLVRGATAREKTVAIDGVPMAEAIRRLGLAS